MSAPSNVFEELLLHLQQFAEKYGWTIVFSGVLYFTIKPYITAFVESRSRSHANRPDRKKVLDSEVQRVRAIQQLNVYKTNVETSGKGSVDDKASKNDNVDKRLSESIKPTPKPKSKPPSTRSDGYNPLTGTGGNVSGFKPSGEMRNLGRQRGG
jgi:hypothetical protein